jgi:hypothetical protein
MNRPSARLARPTWLVALIALAACGLLPHGTDGGGGAPDDPIVQPPVKGAPPPVVEPPADGSLRVQPDPTIVDASPAAVDRFVVGPDGRTVVVYFWGGNEGCFGLAEVRVNADGPTPVITVLEGSRPAAVGAACTMEALLKSVVVRLEQPILADGSGGDPIAGEPILGPALAVTPVAGIANARPHAITGVEVASDGLTLTVHYVGGNDACYGLAGVDVDEGAPLTVTVLEGTRANRDDIACTDEGVTKAVTIELDAALIASGA